MDKINKELILYSLQTNFYYTCIQNEKTICILLEQDEYLYYFMETIELVNEIISSKPPYFIYQKHALFYPLKKSSVTKDVITKMDQIHSLNGINSYFHYHKKHPYFTLFVDQLNSFERDCQYYQSREDAITNFIEAIKKEATSKAIKQALYKLKASVKKNYSSLHNYVHQLMDIYSNLSIIRLDLHYNFTGDFFQFGTGPSKYSYLKFKPITEGRRSLLTPPTDASTAFAEYLKCIRIDYSLVKQHRKQFFEKLKEQFFYWYLVGYAWHLDYNSNKGYFYQILLFFNKTLMDIGLAKQLPSFIINFWREKITHKEGYGSGFYIRSIKTEPTSDHKCLERAISALTLHSLYL